MKAYNLQVALQNPDQTTTLFIHNRNLTEIPEAVFGLKNLKALTLSGNKIKNISARINTLKHLEYVDLSNNLIEAFPKYLCTIKGLKKLNLKGNKLKEIPAEITHLDALEELDLSDNLLTRLPDFIYDLKNLRSLNLSSNSLSKLSEKIQQWLMLEKLDLSKNEIVSLPNELSRCEKIRDLDLSENKIKSLPVNFSSLNELGKLDLHKNKIQDLSDDLQHLTWLRELDLSQNKLQVLPASIGKLSWLFRLNLRKNKLIALPETIGQLSKLQVLNLEYNSLKTFPESMGKMSGLNQLLLKGNKIETEQLLLFQFKKLKSISGLTTVFKSKEKRQFLTFLKQCRQKKISESLALDFYYLLYTEKKSSKSILIEAIDFPNKIVRVKALDQIYKYHNSAKLLTQDSVVAIVGQTNLSKKEVTAKAKEMGFSYKNKLEEQVTHIVLGAFPKQKEFLKKFKGTFLKEQDLFQFIQKDAIKKKASFSTQAIENLQRFLLSKEEQHVNVGIQILKTNGVPQEVISDLFIAYKKAKKASQKKQIRTLLELNGSDRLREKLSLRLGLNENVKEEVLLKNIAAFVKGTELDEARIIQYFQT